MDHYVISDRKEGPGRRYFGRSTDPVMRTLMVVLSVSYWKRSVCSLVRIALA